MKESVKKQAGAAIESPMLPHLIRIFVLVFALNEGFAAEPQVDAAQLPRIPATAPEQAISTFKIKPGFRIELVAAEPLVVDPIAISFDEDGRCYVIEMRDYSERRPERLGRVRLLEDTNGDGRFDKSTVFAADMPWPTAVICWDGGVFVGATPDILYFKDTNGDGVADIRETIFTGFASDFAPFATNKLNVQAMMNSFNWSLDNRIHGATSFSGGKVKLVDSPFVRSWLKRGGVGQASRPPGERASASSAISTTSPTGAGETPALLDLRGRDFSFDPRTLEMRAESGGGQHGLSFDNRGRKYVCSNSSHIQALMYEERYAARNPFYSMPRALVDIAVDGGAAPVFRISADEPWRVIRTQWRVGGLVPGPIEGGGRPSGYFTGATGVTLYRGDAFGPDYVGDAFVGDAGGNLLHRKKLVPDGVGVKAVRPDDEQKVEFLASTDNWFRPVQMANAPDGCLYICDMYREVIEHPWSLPDSIKKHLDLNSGNDRGRIYRIVPEKFRQPKLPSMSKATTEQLVATLQSGNGWHRDTAARLLYQRQDESAVASLAALQKNATNSLGRIHALHALAGLASLEETHIARALEDPDSSVREHGIMLSEHFPAPLADELQAKLYALADDVDASVRYRLALALGRENSPKKAATLARILRQSGFNDPWIQAAVVSSSGQRPVELFNELSGIRSWQDSKSERAWEECLSGLAETIGAANRKDEIESVIDLSATLFDAPGDSANVKEQIWAMGFLNGLAEGLERSGNSLTKADAQGKLKPIMAVAQRNASNPSTTALDVAETLRLRSIRLLGWSRSAGSIPTLAALLAPSQPESIQSAALSSLARFTDATVGTELIARMNSFSPQLRAESIALLLRRSDRALMLLDAIEAEKVPRSVLGLADIDFLRSHQELKVRSQALSLFAQQSSTSRKEALDTFSPALKLAGVASRGQAIFQKLCSTCHRFGNEGHLLGPDLVTVKNAGKEKILVNILDPNREVNSNYLSYLVETKDGESFSGLIVNESGNNVTIRMAGGAESVVARANIASMQSQGKSLMPEGLETGLSPQDMADLLEFVIATP